MIYLSGVLNDRPKALLEVEENLFVDISKSQTNDYLLNKIDLKFILSVKVGIKND